MRSTRPGRAAALPVAVALLVSCGGSDDSVPSGSASSSPTAGASAAVDSAFADDVLAALDAVEAELGPDQAFFEVTATERFTNVFVATGDGTAALPFAFVDGELQPPAPERSGAEGLTFARDDVDLDPEQILSGVATELPDSQIDSLSVYGDGAGVTYVVAATSPNGGVLDVVVGPDGQVLSVAPL